MSKASSAGSCLQTVSHPEVAPVRGPMPAGPWQPPAPLLLSTLVTHLQAGAAEDPAFNLMGAGPLGDLALSEAMGW